MPEHKQSCSTDSAGALANMLGSSQRGSEENQRLSPTQSSPQQLSLQQRSSQAEHSRSRQGRSNGSAGALSGTTGSSRRSSEENRRLSPTQSSPRQIDLKRRSTHGEHPTSVSVVHVSPRERGHCLGSTVTCCLCLSAVCCAACPCIAFSLSSFLLGRAAAMGNMAMQWGHDGQRPCLQQWDLDPWSWSRTASCCPW